jgi:hypothetical protein
MMGKTKQETILLPLVEALAEWVDMQASVNDVVILVRDFNCYRSGGFIVKVDDNEPEGINNSYSSVSDIERDLARVVPGYVEGALIWQEAEVEDDYSF